jgi:hypothetical protein
VKKKKKKTARDGSFDFAAFGGIFSQREENFT